MGSSSPLGTIVVPYRLSPSAWLFEDPNDYIFDGFYSVRLGDLFKNARYKILRKLGHGSYSTVWLAEDTR